MFKGIQYGRDALFVKYANEGSYALKPPFLRFYRAGVLGVMFITL